MGDLFSFLAILFMVLLIWAVSGHFMWWLAATVGKQLFGSRCPKCGAILWNTTCQRCANQSQQSETLSLQSDLIATRRLLAFVKFKSWLSEDQQRLADALVDRVAAGLRGMPATTSSPDTAAKGSSQQPPELAPAIQATIVADSVTTIGGLRTGVPDALSSPIYGRFADPAEAHTGISAGVPNQPIAEVPARVNPGQRGGEPAILNVKLASITPSIHPLDQVIEEPKVRPANRNRWTAGLLRTFMEQSNIRWVELISAALIVVCSVGLVISLWSTLSSTSRFFPSLVFMLATVAVHGAGQYTLKQWKLRSTSRGILHIGLMLIPLAMLVGILLSRRPDVLPQLDSSTLGVIAIGTFVYGGLAVTACRSLFPRDWLAMAAVTIVSSLTLLPIYYAHAHGNLQTPASTWILLPLVLCSQLVVLFLSSKSIRLFRAGHRGKGIDRHMLRTVGMATQSLFAALVVLTFWIIQSKGVSGLNAWWFTASGGWAVAWASWGWSASLPGLGFDRRISNKAKGFAAITAARKEQAVEAAPSSTSSWFSVAAWIVASLASVALLAMVWQLASARVALQSLLCLAAIWWLLHGVYCQLRASLLAGSLALLGAAGLILDGSLAPAVTILQPIDWLGLQRIAIFTGLGLVAICIGYFGQRLLTARPVRDSKPRSWKGSFYFTPEPLLDQLQLAGALTFCASILLTFIASVLPFGAAPFGGSWAGLMLAAYGTLLTAFGVIKSLSRAESDPENQAAEESAGWLQRMIVPNLVPIGLAVLLVGTVRTCQTAPLLDELLADLRPWRAWSVGTSCLALASALVAAFVRITNPESENANNQLLATIRSLCVYSLLLGSASVMALWSHPDGMLLASQLGCFFPLSLLAIYVARRESIWREFALLGLCLWIGSSLSAFGSRWEWWTELVLAGKVGVMVASCVVAAGALQGLSDWLGRRLAVRETSAASIGMVPKFAWPIMLASAWLVSLASMYGPASMHATQCLGGEVLRVSSPYYADAIDQASGGVLLFTLLLLTGATWLVSQSPSTKWVESMCGLLPAGLAMLCLGWVEPSHSLAVGLWLLAVLAAMSELLRFAGGTWVERSESIWQQLVGGHEKLVSGTAWLVTGRGVSVAMLLIGSLAWLWSVFTMRPPLETYLSFDNWSANIGVLSISTGPIILFATLRWAFSLANSGRSSMMVASGLLWAFFAASTAAMALPNSVFSFDRGIAWWQILSLLLSGIAGLTLGFHWIRNFLGLRAMTGGKLSTSQLMSKSMKGARWKRGELAAWHLNATAMAIVAGLSVAAAIAVIATPLGRAPSYERIGGLAVGFTSLFGLGLCWFLSLRRGNSAFGLSALTVVVMAPFGAAAYAHWLSAVPGRFDPQALGFEPLRGLLTLWLVALALGIGVRVLAMRRGLSVNALGEAAWILLALAVGCLGLISTTQDPSRWWPMFELSALAAIAAVSGVLSGQAWRGHTAAVAAAAGLSGWVVQHAVGGDLLHEAWMVLWGPMWIAAISLAAQSAKQFIGPQVDEQSVTPKMLRWPSVDLTVCLSLPVAQIMLSGVWITSQNSSLSPPDELGWWILGLAIASLGLAVSRLWSIQSTKRGLGVYLNLIALSAIATTTLSASAQLPKLTTWLLWLASILGAMAILAGLLRELTRESIALGGALKLGSALTPEKFRHALSWMPIVHTVAALCGLIPAIALVLMFDERGLRIAATALPFIGALSILPIAGDRQLGIFRYVGLSLTSMTLLMLCWADLPNALIDTDLSGLWIFVQRAFCGLVALGIAYPVLANGLRGKTMWVAQLMHIGWAATLLAAVTGGTLLLGLPEWKPHAESASLPTKLLTLLAWVGLFGRFIQFAAKPHATDVGAAIPLRKASVYAAQAAAVCWARALYLHFPNLFHGILTDWWPIAIFSIAMLSAGIGEWLRRQQQTILADPLERSSLLLPLIPLLGVWWLQSETMNIAWNEWGRYALLLVAASGLYGLHGWMRDSQVFRSLSGLMALFAFWAFLQSNPDLRFFEHPQFWLLPPAIATLLYVEFNRERLAAEVVAGLRYACVLIAYLSSTSEVLFRSFSGQLWQPILLLALALLGVAAGMLMRVRAFLYCGLAFTVVALLGMVWHAQQAIGQVWPWWVFGIATGVCLIVCLGYFEKNRPRVLAYLEQLRKWES